MTVPSSDDRAPDRFSLDDCHPTVNLGNRIAYSLALTTVVAVETGDNSLFDNMLNDVIGPALRVDDIPVAVVELLKAHDPDYAELFKIWGERREAMHRDQLVRVSSVLRGLCLVLFDALYAIGSDDCLSQLRAHDFDISTLAAVLFGAKWPGLTPILPTEVVW